MPDFKRLYLDATVLRKSNWPHISAELSFLLESARNFGFGVLIPEAVEIEREAQWLRDLVAATQKLDSAADKLSMSLEAVSAARVEIGVRNVDALRTAFRAQSDAAKATHRIRTAAITTRPISEFLRLAVERTPPFQIAGDKVTGFQDTVILLSIIDEAKAAGVDHCGIVSDDDVFSKVRHLTEREGISLRHFRTTHDVWKLLAEEISPQVIEWWNQQRVAIRLALESRVDRIVQVLREKVTPEMVTYRVEKIEGIDRPEILDVDIPLPTFPNEPGPYQRLEDAKFRVSLKVGAEFRTLASPGLSAMLATPFFRQLQERSLGKTEGQPPTKELQPETFWKKIDLETTATYSQGQYEVAAMEFVCVE